MTTKKLIVDVESQKLDKLAAHYGISRKQLVEEILAAVFTLDLGEASTEIPEDEPLTVEAMLVACKSFQPSKRKTGCPGWTEERKARVSAAMKGKKIGAKNAAV